MNAYTHISRLRKFQRMRKAYMQKTKIKEAHPTTIPSFYSTEDSLIAVALREVRLEREEYMDPALKVNAIDAFVQKIKERKFKIPEMKLKPFRFGEALRHVLP